MTAIADIINKADYKIISFMGNRQKDKGNLTKLRLTVREDTCNFYPCVNVVVTYSSVIMIFLAAFRS